MEWGSGVDLHFVLRLTAAWPGFVRLSDSAPGNPGLELQREVLSQFGSVTVSVCAQPENQLDELISALNFPLDDSVLKWVTPFEGVSEDSIVMLFDAPAFLDEAGVVTVMDALFDKSDRCFQLYTNEGRPLPVYALHSRNAFSFQIKRAHSLVVPSIVPLSSVSESHSFREMMRSTVIKRHIENGVIMQAPESIVIDEHVTIAPETFIGAGVVLRGHTSIGAGCKISQGSLVDNCKIGERCTINASQVYLSTLESDISVGPYAHIRPGCYLSSNTRVGSFVELKNTRVGPDSGIPHLSYIGDTQIGRHVNVGCGVITANFNGTAKHRTQIEDHAFVGSNSVLLAPMTVGEGAIIAAGSTITDDVPPYALSVARARQTNKEDWARDREKNW